MLVRQGGKGQARIFYHAVADRMKARQKKKNLRNLKVLSDVPRLELTPDKHYTWLVPEYAAEYSEMIMIGSRAGKTGHHEETIFGVHGRGVAMSRDDVLHDFEPEGLASRVKTFIEGYNPEVDRYAREAGDGGVDDSVRYDNIQSSRNLKLDVQRRSFARFDEA